MCACVLRAHVCAFKMKTLKKMQMWPQSKKKNREKFLTTFLWINLQVAVNLHAFYGVVQLLEQEFDTRYLTSSFFIAFFSVKYVSFAYFNKIDCFRIIDALWLCAYCDFSLSYLARPIVALLYCIQYFFNFLIFDICIFIDRVYAIGHLCRT